LKAGARQQRRGAGCCLNLWADAARLRPLRCAAARHAATAPALSPQTAGAGPRRPGAGNHGGVLADGAAPGRHQPCAAGGGRRAEPGLPKAGGQAARLPGGAVRGGGVGGFRARGGRRRARSPPCWRAALWRLWLQAPALPAAHRESQRAAAGQLPTCSATAPDCSPMGTHTDAAALHAARQVLAPPPSPPFTSSHLCRSWTPPPPPACWPPTAGLTTCARLQPSAVTTSG
jgi:hypothetical protein